jgi:hypothetical protein
MPRRVKAQAINYTACLFHIDSVGARLAREEAVTFNTIAE